MKYGKLGNKLIRLEGTCAINMMETKGDAQRIFINGFLTEVTAEEYGKIWGWIRSNCSEIIDLTPEVKRV